MSFEPACRRHGVESSRKLMLNFELKNRTTFTKEERLTRKKLISEVFSSGQKIQSAGFLFIVKEVDIEMPFPVQVLINVPKRKHKKAVDRNQIKRRMREAYRLNKALMYSELEGKKLALIILYVGQSKPSFEKCHRQISDGLKKIGLIIK